MKLFDTIRPLWIPAALLLTGLVHALALHDFPGPSGDSAEFQHLGRVLGISHPTGYPLYLLATHLWDALIPFGTAAWRVNLFSLACGLGALGFLAAIGRGLGLRESAVAAGVLALGLAPPWMRLCTVAEVYSLHLLLLLAALHRLLAWQRGGRPRDLHLGVALGVLGLAHHLAIVVAGPAGLLLLARGPWRAALRPALLVPVAAVLALVAVLYSYVFIRSADPNLEFAYARVTNAREFVAYVTGAQYQERAEAMPGLAGRVLGHTVDAARVWGALLPLLALGAAARFRHADLPALLALAAAQLLFMGAYRIADIADYALPVHAVAAVLLMAGVDRLLTAAIAPRARLAALAAAALLAAPFLLQARGTLSDLRAGHARADADAIRAALDTGPNALLVVPHWQQFAVGRYHHAVNASPGAVRMLVPGDAAANGGAGFTEHLRAWTTAGKRVLVFAKPGALHDLAGPLAATRAVTRPFNPFITEVLAAP